MIPLIDLSWQHNQIDLTNILAETTEAGQFVGGQREMIHPNIAVALAQERPNG
jgi:hypothetical protein